MPQSVGDEKETMPKAAKIWFYLIIGAFVLVIGLMFALVAWRDYRVGGLDDALLALAIPILLVFFWVTERVTDRLSEKSWTKGHPRLWKALKELMGLTPFVIVIAGVDLDFTQSWGRILLTYLRELALFFGLLFVIVTLWDLAKDWYRGKI